MGAEHANLTNFDTPTERTIGAGGTQNVLGTIDITTLKIGGVTVTASADELNQVADSSARYEVVTATNVLTAAESGKVFFLHAAAGFLTTFPAPALGLEYEFIVKTAPTSVGYTFAPNGGTANILVVNVAALEINDTVDGISDDDADLVTLVANQAAVGDRLVARCDGTKWFLTGQIKLTAGLTAATT